MKRAFLAFSLLALCVSAWPSRAADITATGSGNWSSTTPDAPWPQGIVPGANDSVDIEAPFAVTVDTNVTILYLYGSGTATMGPGKTLTVLGDSAGARGTQQLTTFNATAPSNTVIYLGNDFWAKRTDYYNLVFTNATTNIYDFYNGAIPGSDAVPMTIAGDMTIVGKVKVQEGADFTINGNLVIGTNSSWDCSSYFLTVGGNTTVSGLLLDLDGALGYDNFMGNMTVTSNAIGWNISDVTQWHVGGSLTNNALIVGKGYGSITFDGTGVITGKPFTIPTLTVNGTYSVGTTITLNTNTPTLNGTLVFDLATTNKLVFTNVLSPTLFYNGVLEVLNSGPAPVSGKTFKLFSAASYGGSFSATSFPSLATGLSWEDDLVTTGSITVTGTAVGGGPTLSYSRSGNTLMLSWDSATFPGFSVQAQTNAAGVGSNWQLTSSGTVSPFAIGLNPSGPPVFFRLAK
jgi:hypothetical protein